MTSHQPDVQPDDSAEMARALSVARMTSELADCRRRARAAHMSDDFNGERQFELRAEVLEKLLAQNASAPAASAEPARAVRDGVRPALRWDAILAHKLMQDMAPATVSRGADGFQCTNWETLALILNEAAKISLQVQQDHAEEARSRSDEPAWKARKALMELHDDGHGPYMEHLVIPLPMTSAPPPFWDDFKVWANDHLGQGYSLACADGSLLDEVTGWCYRGYCAGRRKQEEVWTAPAEKPELRQEFEDAMRTLGWAESMFRRSPVAGRQDEYVEPSAIGGWQAWRIARVGRLGRPPSREWLQNALDRYGPDDDITAGVVPR